jgi:hypothetical protein
MKLINAARPRYRSNSQNTDNIDRVEYHWYNRSSTPFGRGAITDNINAAKNMIG